MASATTDPASTEARTFGGRFLQWWATRDRRPLSTHGPWSVEVVDRGWGPAYFDELLPAADYEVKGLNRRNLREGHGIAMVGCRANRGATPEERYFPSELITRPVTAILRQRGPHHLLIELRDPLKDDSLAADFSGPIAQLLSRTGPLRRSGVSGLVLPINPTRRYGLFLLQPYDPDKTPVLFVHGLLSTPLAWAHLTHDLWADEVFRHKHQVWHYFYPTAAPFLHSAKHLRHDLAEARRTLDPKGVHRASRRLDIIAHSMGGLLSRTLVTNSGERIWNTVFNASQESLVTSGEDRQAVLDTLHWQALPEVRTVTFIATPHRGSRIAEGPIGRLGDELAALPRPFTSLYQRLHASNPKLLQPYFQHSLSKGHLSSIDALSPQNPILPALLSLPIPSTVTLHSIIGSHDPIVPYESSHLENAVSELVVSTGHRAFTPPEVREEILRILRAR